MDDWSFFPDENRLEQGNEVAHLTGKATAVLNVLLQRPGDVITRDEIQRAVWKDVHVTPDLVREYISDLRRALGDDAASPKHIETIRGKGFRLLGGVDFARRQIKQGFHMQRPRVAVMRPVCFEGGPRWQRFASGMAEELIVDLARFSDIALIGRSASFGADASKGYVQIGERLGCDFLVESSLSVWSDRLRAQFLLIECQGGTQVWAERYECPIGHLPELSRDIALKVANELGGWTGEILRAERRYAMRRPINRLTAYEDYVVAAGLEQFLDSASRVKGLEHIDRAIDGAPDFARNHLVRTLYCDHWDTLAPELGHDYWLAERRASIDEAYLLDPRDPFVLALRGRILATAGELPSARDAVTRAADYACNQADVAANAGSAATLVNGDFETADRLIQTAFNLNPCPPEYYNYMHARNLLFWQRYEEAEQVTETGPDYVSTNVVRCLAQSMLGKVDEARSTLRKIQAKRPEFDFDVYARSLGIASESVLEVYREAIQRL